MKQYIDLEEAIKCVIRIGCEHAIDEPSEEAPMILGRMGADIVFALNHLERKEE